MEITKTWWHPFPNIRPEPGMSVHEIIEEQPGFGLEIRWNNPRRWWEPFLVISLWRRKIQIGWLY